MKAMVTVVVLGCVGFGMSLGAGQDGGKAPSPTAPANAVTAAEKPEKADPVFWGKVEGGLQAGLTLVETKTERAGAAVRLEVKLEVKVRNVGKAPVAITFGSPWERWPEVADAAGKKVPVKIPELRPPFLLKGDQVIEPGKTFSLSHPTLVVEVDGDQPLPKYVTTPTVRARPGTYTISYEWVADSHEKLGTGGLPFKVMGADKEAKAGPGEGRGDDAGPRAIVERYVAAALAGKFDDAVGLAVKGTSPAKRARVEELGKRVEAVLAPNVYADPGEALVVSEIVKLAKPQPDGADKGYLVFTVVQSGGVWRVKDIDFTSLDGVITRVLKFRTQGRDARGRPAAESKAEAGPESTLVGAWKLVSARYDGEAATFPEGYTTIKHVAVSQFLVATRDKSGKLTRALGGGCSLKGDLYEEAPEYGTGDDFDAVKGKPQTFKWKLEGNRWRHTGRLSNGLSVEEVWERVEKR